MNTKYRIVKSYTRGFTLIELMVVIVIIGLLASVVMAMMSESRERGRDAQRASQGQEFLKAIELYYADNGRYPDDGSSDFPGIAVPMNTIETDLVNAGYISSIPPDPRYSAAEGYRYCATDDGSTFSLWIHTENNGGGTDYCTINRGPQIDFLNPTGWCSLNGEEPENTDECQDRFQ